MQKIDFSSNATRKPRILIQHKHHGPYPVAFRHFRATDVPRNPFISCRRSPGTVETIRYTWNQLARSAGKWVKGLMVPKQRGGGGREKERKKDGCRVAAVWEMTLLHHCRVHLPSCVSSFLATRAFPFSYLHFVPSIYISTSVFIPTFHCLPSFRDRFSSSSRAPMTCLCLHSPILLPTNGSSREGWTRLRDEILRHFHSERPQLNRR